MGNGEIKVDQVALKNEIQSLRNLLCGSGYARSGELLTRGYGETHNALNRMFKDLKDTEKMLMDLIEITATALENGSLQFKIADNQASSDIAAIDGTLVGE